MGWGREEVRLSHELIIVEVWVWVHKGSLSQVVCSFETFHYKSVFFKYPIYNKKQQTH